MGRKARASFYRTVVRSNARNRRSRHALKTTVAVVLVTGVFFWSDVQTRLMAAVAAAFLMQCVGGGDRAHQQRCMGWSALAMVAISGAGPALVGLPAVKEALLVAAAFCVVRVRRLLRDANAFPLFLFTYTVLATALPGGRDVAGRQMVGTAVAAAVSYVVYFYVGYQPDVPAPGVIPGPRTPWRTALAAMLAIGIAYAFHLPRAYWAVLTSVVVVSETWKESWRKVLERVGMTALGCGVAWGLHMPTAHLPHVELGLMFLFVYLAVHFRGASYPLMTFFITLYVAFLFSVLGEWSGGILLVRMYETAIGGATALAAAAMVRPRRDRPEDGPSGTRMI